MTHSLTLACIQTRPRPDFDAAIKEARGKLEAACDAGAEFVLLPEYCGGLRTEDGAFRPPAAEEDKHPVLQDLCAFAKERSVWMMIGSVAVPGPAGKIYNRGFVVNDQGQVVSRYNKIHLFDIQLSARQTFEESRFVEPGDALSLVDTPWGKVGHTICYDLRFPMLYRQLAQSGADILAVPAAFTKKTGEAHWHVLNRARAIENGAFVTSPCAIGKVDGGGECYGHSLIVDPWGHVCADAGETGDYAMATIDMEMVKETRRKIPSLTHDRPFSPVVYSAEAAE